MEHFFLNGELMKNVGFSRGFDGKLGICSGDWMEKNNDYVIYPECSKYPDRRCLEN
jgi:hypothetical protein